MVNPAKARQIGFFSCLIIGVFQLTITNITLQFLFSVRRGDVDIKEIYQTLDIIFPVLLLCTWYYGRKLGTQILIEGKPAFKTAFRSMLRLIILTMVVSMLLPLIYFFIIEVVKNGGLFSSFIDNINISTFFTIIGSIIGLLLINLFPSAISGWILSHIFKRYQ